MRILLSFTVVMFAALILSAPSVAQQAVTRLEGKITDKSTGKPVGCKMYIYNAEGKKTRSLNSNEADGGYLAVLNDGGKHKIVLAGHNVYKAEYEVDIPASTKFQEVFRDFAVEQFVEGKVLMQDAAFELNSAVLKPSVLKQIKEIEEALTVNQQLNVVVTVRPDEDLASIQREELLKTYFADSLEWASEMVKYEKKYRKKKTKPDPPVAPVRPVMQANPNEQLLKDRVASMKKQLNDARNAELRISYQTEKLQPSALLARPENEILEEVLADRKKKKKSKSKTSDTPTNAAVKHNTLIVTIGEVKRLYE